MKNKEITLKDIAELIIPKLWIILLISALCAGIAVIYSSFFKDDTYTSTSQHYVFSKSSQSTEATTGSVDVAKGMVEVYKIVLKSDKFLNGVAEKLQDTEYSGITTAQIRSMMTITQASDTEIFSISITAPTPEMAFAILEKVVEHSTERLPVLIQNGFEVAIINDPTYAKAANPKNTIRNAIIVFMLAAVVTVIAIWIRSLFDVVIRDKKKIEDNINIPILGVIPKHETYIQKGDAKNV